MESTTSSPPAVEEQSVFLPILNFHDKNSIQIEHRWAQHALRLIDELGDHFNVQLGRLQERSRILVENNSVEEEITADYQQSRREVINCFVEVEDSLARVQSNRHNLKKHIGVCKHLFELIDQPAQSDLLQQVLTQDITPTQRATVLQFIVGTRWLRVPMAYTFETDSEQGSDSQYPEMSLTSFQWQMRVNWLIKNASGGKWEDEFDHTRQREMDRLDEERGYFEDDSDELGMTEGTSFIDDVDGSNLVYENEDEDWFSPVDGFDGYGGPGSQSDVSW